MAAIAQSDLRALRETTVRRHVEAENSHDLAATLATFDHPLYEVVPFASQFDGSEAVQNLLGDLMKAFPDFNAEILKMHHADDAVIPKCKLLVHNEQSGPGSRQAVDEWIAVAMYFSV